MIQYSIVAHTPTQWEEIKLHIRKNSTEWLEISSDINSEVLNLIIEFCKAEGIILTIVDNYDLLIDRRLHGIRFTSDYEKIELLRTQAGAHPIVGVNISDISDLKQLRYLDIDYLVINVPKIGADDSCLLVKGIKKQWNIRVVGEIDTIDSATQNKLLEAGFDGFCLKL